MDVKYTQLANNGCIYYVGRASPGFQPLIVYNFKKFFELIDNLEEMLNHIFFFNEWMVNNLLVPGKIENWMTIMDFGDVNLSDIPVKKLKELTSLMQRNFRGRMTKAFFVNNHWLLQGVWKMVFGWLDEFVQQKIKFCNGDEIKQSLLKYVDEDVLEEKYGGKRPNITENFFPP